MRIIILSALLVLPGCATLSNVHQSCTDQFQKFSQVAACVRNDLGSTRRDDRYYLAKVAYLEDQVEHGEMTDMEAKLQLEETARSIQQGRVSKYLLHRQINR